MGAAYVEEPLASFASFCFCDFLLISLLSLDCLIILVRLFWHKIILFISCSFSTSFSSSKKCPSARSDFSIQVHEEKKIFILAQRVDYGDTVSG